MFTLQATIPVHKEFSSSTLAKFNVTWTNVAALRKRCIKHFDDDVGAQSRTQVTRSAITRSKELPKSHQNAVPIGEPFLALAKRTVPLKFWMKLYIELLFPRSRLTSLNFGFSEKEKKRGQHVRRTRYGICQQLWTGAMPLDNRKSGAAMSASQVKNLLTTSLGSDLILLVS